MREGEAGEAARVMREPRSYHRHCFLAEIISHAVWLYHVFSLSVRHVELILAERGVVVTHESIRAWCKKFGAEFAKRLRRRRPQPGDTWHLDEVFIRLNGVLHYLWRAVDQHDHVSSLLMGDFLCQPIERPVPQCRRSGKSELIDRLQRLRGSERQQPDGRCRRHAAGDSDHA